MFAMVAPGADRVLAVEIGHGDAEAFAITGGFRAEKTRLLAHQCVHARGRFGITVAYFDSEDAIRAWRDHGEHASTRAEGRARWYDGFAVRGAKGERAYEWERGNA